MYFSQIKGLFRILHVRLVLWNIGVMLVAVGLTLFTLRTSVRMSLLWETDQLLREDANEIELAVAAMHPDIQSIREEITRHTESHRHRGLFVQLFDRDEKLIWTSRGGGKAPLPDKPHLKKNGLFSAKDYRVLDKNMTGNSKQHLLGFRVGSMLELVDNEVEELTWLMIASMGIMVFLAPIGGYLLAVQATRPVRKIIDATAKMKPQNLQERFTVQGTGDELDRLANTINGFLDRIASFLNSNRDFVANASHELRSPLASILTAAEMGLSRTRTEMEYREILTDITEKCDHFRILVNQLLVIAEAEGNVEVKKGKVDLSALVRKTGEMFRDFASGMQLELQVQVDEGIHVSGQTRLVQQLVNNLLDNALKYSLSGGKVMVTLVREEEKIILKVEDEGTGIAPKDLPLVFNRFFRSDRSRQKDETHPGGYGLGLSICKAVVESMNGTIQVAPRFPKGTVFTVQLPALLMQDMGYDAWQTQG